MIIRGWNCAAAGLMALAWLEVSAASAQFPWRGAALLETEMVSGAYWDIPMATVVDRLGIREPKQRQGLCPEWFMESALAKLWGLEKTAEFARFEASGGAWLLAHKGKMFGYLVKVPLAERESYDALARKRFGQDRMIHFDVAPPTATEPARFVHCNLWRDAKTELLFLTATPKGRARVWKERQTGTTMELEILYRVGDSGVPLYLVFADAKRLSQIRSKTAPVLP